VPREVPGVVVRPFVVGQDEQAWLHVNARAFAHHPEQGRMTLKDLQAREEEPWFSAEDLLLAEVDGTVLASVWMKVEPGSDAGELYVLAVDPDAQGRGLGRLLTATTLDHLAAAGLRRCVLYTDATSTAAVRTYTSAGFRTSRVDVQYS
jgi:mycothiol synthase